MNKTGTEKGEKQELLLEQDLKALEDELTEKYFQLGKSVYELADQKVAQINRLVDRLVDTRVKLTGMKEQRMCIYCLAQNPRDNLFCGHCGQKLGEEQEGESQ